MPMQNNPNSTKVPADIMRAQRQRITKPDDQANHDFGLNGLATDILDIGTAQNKIASMPLTHCDYIMSEFLKRMHDLFETECSANYIATGAEFKGILKKDGIAYRITVIPVKGE